MERKKNTAALRLHAEVSERNADDLSSISDSGNPATRLKNYLSRTRDTTLRDDEVIPVFLRVSNIRISSLVSQTESAK
jgi:hypothetical protein